MSIVDGDSCELMLKQRNEDYRLIFFDVVVVVVGFVGFVGAVPGPLYFSIFLSLSPACHCRAMECTAKHSHWSCA